MLERLAGVDALGVVGSLEASNRVVISQLPPNISVTQVLAAITSNLGLISIMMVDTSAIEGKKAMTAFVQFVSSDDADDFIEDTSAPDSLIYIDGDGVEFAARTWLVPPPAWGISIKDQMMINHGYTRCLFVSSFPSEALWFFINCVGARYITNVDYDIEDKVLKVEFVSIFQSSRVAQMLLNDRFPYWRPNQRGDNRHGHMSYLNYPPDGTVDNAEISFDELSPVPYSPLNLDVYNARPYNNAWPEIFLPVMHPEGLAPRPSRSVVIDHQLSVLENCVLLSRKHWSWENPGSNHQDALLANTIGTDEWGDAWNLWFQKHRADSIDLQAYHAYGQVAAHRRQAATSQGLGQGTVPQCNGCPHHCVALHTQAAPSVVQNYTLDGYNEDDDDDNAQADNSDDPDLNGSDADDERESDNIYDDSAAAYDSIDVDTDLLTEEDENGFNDEDMDDADNMESVAHNI